MGFDEINNIEPVTEVGNNPSSNKFFNFEDESVNMDIPTDVKLPEVEDEIEMLDFDVSLPKVKDLTDADNIIDDAIKELNEKYKVKMVKEDSDNNIKYIITIDKE